MLRESLANLERRLVGFGFFRTHRAELVNGAAVEKLAITGHTGMLFLTDGQQARVSKRYLASAKRFLSARAAVLD